MSNAKWLIFPVCLKNRLTWVTMPTKYSGEWMDGWMDEWRLGLVVSIALSRFFT